MARHYRSLVEARVTDARDEDQAVLVARDRMIRQFLAEEASRRTLVHNGDQRSEEEGDEVIRGVQDQVTQVRGPAMRLQPMKLRAAVVGLGVQALVDHIPGLCASDRAELVAVCDEDPEIMREQQYRHGVQGYTDFRDMFIRAQGTAHVFRVRALMRNTKRRF
jgi:hypothetical protein